MALQQLLSRMGFEAPAGTPRRPGLDDLPPDRAEQIMRLYRALGGTSSWPSLRPGHWDLAFRDGVLIELDEELHFNRYRRVTLEPAWTMELPWRDDYLAFAVDHEAACLAAGRWGRRWTNRSCDALFGAADPPGVFGTVGAPRWKQRALYDAIKDAVALTLPEITVVRLATIDVVGDVRLGAVLEGHARADLDALRELVAARST